MVLAIKVWTSICTIPTPRSCCSGVSPGIPGAIFTKTLLLLLLLFYLLINLFIYLFIYLLSLWMYDMSSKAFLYPSCTCFSLFSVFPPKPVLGGYHFLHTLAAFGICALHWLSFNLFFSFSEILILQQRFFWPPVYNYDTYNTETFWSQCAYVCVRVYI